MKNPQMLKVFLVFILSVVYIFSFSHFGASAYNQLFKNQGQFGENTVIGNIDVSGKTKQQAETLLNERIESWKKSSVLTIRYKESSMTVDNGIFTFQTDKTLSSVKPNAKNKVIVSVDQTALVEDIYDMALSLASESLEKDKLANDLAVSAEDLTEGTKTFQLENYIPGETGGDEVIVNAEVELGKQETAMKQLVSNIQPIEMKAQTQTSLLQILDRLDEKDYSADTLSRLATAIYQVVLPTNFTIIERNISNELPSFAELGYEAHIDMKTGNDLIFANVNDSDYRIELEVKGGKLIASLVGRSFLNSYTIETKDEKHYSPKTIKQYSDELGPSAVQVKREGKDGITVKVLRHIESSSGDLLDTETISDDFYAPIHRIEMHGLDVQEGASSTEPENGDSATGPEDDQTETESGEAENDESGSASEDSQEEDAEEPASGSSIEKEDDTEANGKKDDSGQEAGGYPRYEEETEVPQK